MDIVRNAAFLVEVCFHSEQMLTLALMRRRGKSVPVTRKERQSEQ